MKRYFSRAAFVFVLMSLVTWASVASGQDQINYAPNQVIIKVKSWVPPAQVRELRAALNASPTREFESIGAELWTIEGIAVPDAVDLLKNDPRVDYIEPDYIVHADDLFPNDPRFSELWGLHNTGQTGGTSDADIDAPEAWSLETGGEVLVGVIDTGVDWHHPDLAANIYTNPGEIPANGVDDDGNGYIDDVHGWDFVNNDNDPYDDHGHGTHVSGTIAGVGNNGVGVTGVSWTARILPIKFLDAGGGGTTSAAILSVQYATLMGVRLTNNSWGGGGYSDALRSAIAAAGSAGILFVAAAGNSAMDNDLYPHYPSSYDLENIISVASTTDMDQMSSFSNWGLGSVDLGAPGSDILSTLPGSSYGVYSGTSMASPHVSGAVSLVWAAAPLMTHLEVKNTLMTSVDVIPALSGSTVSGGRLNVFNALSGLDSIPPDPVVDLAVESTGSNTATLTWAAPGDDGSEGTASVYDLRYSTSPIDEGNFDSATRATGLPHPQPVGSEESFMVKGLDFNTTYYFGLVTEDEQVNRSTLSNIPSGTTLGAPQLTYSPGSFSDALLTGGSSVQTLTIDNTGEGTLDFSFLGAGAANSQAGGAPAVFPSWLRANPPTGRVWTGESLEIEIVFDATGLFGGDYAETIVLETNDPSNPAVPIAVSLHVTNAPDISVAPDSLDFGVHYLGTCATLDVVVTNIGSEELVVSGLVLDNPEYSTNTSGFTLGLGETRVVGVSFCPVTAGALPGTLTIQSNDPDHPTLVVTLRGTGLEPPVISVAPPSLTQDLFTGEVATQTLTVTNSGGSDLNFDIAITEAAVQSRLGPRTRGDGSKAIEDRSSDVTPASGAGARDAGPLYSGRKAGKGTRTIPPVSPQAGGVLDLRVLLLHSASVSEIQGLLLAFPDISVVDAFDGGGATPTLDVLDDYDAVILIANSSYGDPTAIGNVLADYVDMGGGVIMTIATFIDGWDVGGRFASGGYFPFTLGSGPVGSGTLAGYDTSHLIMKDVTTAWGDLLGATSLAPGAVWVADWDIGQPFIATQGDRVAGINVFLSDGGYWTGDVPLILHNAVLWSTGATAWLTVDPLEGVVPAGGSLDVAVTFDASGLDGGDYDALLSVANNDPFNQEVAVPAHLHVTGAPDIGLSETLIDYGPVFIGAAVPHTITIANDGTDALIVSDIVSSHADFTVDVTSMTLAPRTSQDVVVSFAPTTVAPIAGTLSIASNDPDEGVIVVSLMGEGIEPPVISVSPDSLADSLYTGEQSNHTVTIANTGGSDLVWKARSVVVDAATAQTYALTAPVAGRVDPETGASIDPGINRTTPISASLMGLTGVAILWDRSHGEQPMSSWSVIISDLIARGATATENFEPITSTLLEDYDLLWLTDYMDFFATSEILAVQAWVRAGGSLFFECDESLPQIASLLSGLGSGITYLDPPASAGTTTNIYPHETTEGVSSVELAAPQSNLAVSAPAGVLVDDAFDLHVCAYSEVDDGRIFALSDEIFNDYVIGAADNQLFVNQVIDWLTGGPGWLIVTPSEGTVSPGNAQNVGVTFNAFGMNAGDYAGSVVFSNNDPLRPEIAVGASLHVTGSPDIDLSETLIDYGAVFIGAAVPHTITIANDGTDVLIVSGIVSSHGDYTVDVTNFALAPGVSRDVVVTFAPTTVAPITGSLSITSNDPDEPVIEISLSGEGLAPPVIAVTPESLDENLFTGETSTQALTITNTGGSDLAYTLRLDFAPLSSAPATTSGRGPLVPVSGTGYEGGAVPGVPVIANGPTLNQTDPTPEPVALAAEYTGAFLHFGITDYGEIMPFQYPVGNEHLRVGSYIAGYTIAYMAGGVDYVCHAGFDRRSGIAPVSFTELVNDPVRVVAEVVTRTTDNRLRVVQRFTFLRSDKYIAIRTTLENTSGGPLDDVVFKSFADWDVDGDYSDDSWDYHSTLHTVFAWDNKYTAIGSQRTPDLMDIYGWDDYARRQTVVDYPVGPVHDLDGLEVLHFEMGDLAAGGSTDLATVYASGDDLADLESGLRRGLAGWLTLEPAAGVVPPGGSANVTVTFDATGLDGGDYTADIIVASNDPLNPELVVPAHLRVTAIPDIEVSVTSIDFGTLYVGGSVSRSVTVSNVGNDNLVVSAVASTVPAVTANPVSFVVPQSGSRIVQTTFAPTTPGAVSGILTISSNDPDEGEVPISFVGTAILPPDIAVSPPSLSETLFSGEASTQILTIANPGASRLSFSISSAPAVDAVAADSAGSDSAASAPEGENAVSWLTFTPTSGLVEPGSSVNVTVGFNAASMLGGTYNARLTISTNVPSKPAVLVPASLHVIGIPSIVVSETLLEFGTVFIGYPKSVSFTVRNAGTDVLAVSGISADDPSFAAAPSFFDLSPGYALPVSVTCAPGETGSVAAVLTIANNDPDTPALHIDMTAETLMPPVVSMSPPLIETVLESGQTRVDSIYISNLGGSNLMWDAQTGLFASTNASHPAVGAEQNGGPNTALSPTGSYVPETSIGPTPSAPASGLRILWHGDHGLGDIMLWSVIVADLESKGAAVTQSSAPITPGLLAGFDVIWFGNRATPFTTDEMSTMVTWVGGGGHLLIEADSEPSRAVYNALLEGLGAGVYYSFPAGVTGLTVNIFPHETTAGVDEMYLMTAQRILIVAPPGGELVADLFNRTIIAYSVSGDGRIVVVSDHTFHDLAINNADNRVFANQVFEWFGATKWLSVTPNEGTVAPGETSLLEVTTNAAGLAPGVYELNVFVHSNDPASPVAAVPVQVTVVPVGSLLPSVECPADMVVPALSTVPSVTLEGFRIINMGSVPCSFVYSVTAEGPATLNDNGDPASLSGTTPTLSPGASYEPPDAGLIVPAIRALLYEFVTYRAGVNDLAEAASCTTVVKFEPPVPVLIGRFDAVAVEEGVDLSWEVVSDEEILGFRIYRGLEGSTREEISPAGLISPQARSYRDDVAAGGRTYEYTLGVVVADHSEVVSRSVSVTTRAFALALRQNTPNPFNPTTVISFTLPEKTRVTVSIYDVKGRRVRTLVDESIDEGYHERIWDGKDDGGGQVSTGIYFYSLTADDRRLTRKMLLLK